MLIVLVLKVQLLSNSIQNDIRLEIFNLFFHENLGNEKLNINLKNILCHIGIPLA
jgi:hypothetical protein